MPDVVKPDEIDRGERVERLIFSSILQGECHLDIQDAHMCTDCG